MLSDAHRPSRLVLRPSTRCGYERRQDPFSRLAAARAYPHRMARVGAVVRVRCGNLNPMGNHHAPNLDRL